MLKKFTEGLVFGGGFTLSFIALWYIAAYFIAPMFVSSKLEQEANKYLSDIETRIQSSGPKSSSLSIEQGIPFHEMRLEEKIKTSRVVALAKYERASDGKMKAVIKEFLKKDQNIVFYYNIGDEHPSSSYYPEENTTYGDGVILFFAGSPASMRMSMTYSGDRIKSLGDIPIELFRKKCKEPNA